MNRGPGQHRDETIHCEEQLAMSDIFVSYRRSDSSAIVGRVIDRLETNFGKEHIFRDLDSIDYGQDFGKVIKEALAGCKVCLVIIGDDWIDVREDVGKRRLDNIKDWVRVEVSNALEQGVHVIPVLVEKAVMPDENQLPENLKRLTSRNAAKVRDDPDFNVDMERLCTAIKKHLSGTSPKLWGIFTKPRTLVTSAVVLCFLVLVAAFYADLGTLIGGFRNIVNKEVGTITSKGYQLKIERVELFPHSDSASVQVNAIVNGTRFTYPSIGGAEWLQIAPSMAGQIFRLPKADHYEIRFEMLKREQGIIEETKLLSQETITFSEGSAEGRYGLHVFDSTSKTRSGQTSAEIIYSIHSAQ